MSDCVASGSRGFCVLALVALGFGFALEAAAASFTPILVLGASSTVVAGVSADGSEVVGTSVDVAGKSGFRWTPTTGATGIGFMGPRFSRVAGVSADGSTVVGTFEQPVGQASCDSDGDGMDPRPFRWTISTGMVPLVATLGFPACAFATSVSPDGEVVTVNVIVNENNAYRWTASGGLQGVGIGFPSPGSIAYAASFDGSVVVGEFTRYPEPGQQGPRFEAFRWDEAMGTVGLGFLSSARLVSWDGSLIVGTSAEVFRWTSALGAIGLGFSGTPTGMTADGSVVVGHRDPGGAPFLWDAASGVRDLRVALESEFDLASALFGWTLAEVTGISADGRAIVGNGTDPEGRSAGWIAVIPEPSTLPLLASGVAGLLRLRRLIA